MRTARVILDIRTRALDKPFDYLIPKNMAGLEVGCCVLVDFANRPSTGYVVGFGSTADDEDLSRFKFIDEVLSTPWFSEASAECAEWIARRYLAPLSEAIRLFVPPGATPKVRRVTSEDDEGKRWELAPATTAPVDDRWVHITPEGREFIPPKTAIKQQAVIEALKEGEMRLPELSLQVGAVNATVKALERRGLVVVEKRRRLRGVVEDLPADKPVHTLTHGQDEALSAIEAAYEAGKGGVVLLDGVTGSGKTEVYLRAIRHVLERGHCAIVLVPEISLTPQTVARFRARFGSQVAVLHSGMSEGERYDQWDLCRCGSARVVVGARSALFAPLRDVRLIVIDEEHENTYKQDSSPRYNARDVAIHMMARLGGAVVLGSATPSIESLANARTGTYTRVEMPERATECELPGVAVVDMGAEFGAGHRSMFSRPLSSALDETLKRGEKAVLFLNQRGFASFLLCRECGYVPHCEQCSTSLTYHESRYGAGSLECHHCGHHEEAPVRCPRCGSPYLKRFGAGTQRVADELRALVGDGVTIVRMDADTTKNKGAHEKLLGTFAAADGGILLGTQMIAKGLDFPDVTLVGVINADTTLNLPDFRSGERTYQLLEQVSGRAGRAELPGRVIIQTYWPDHPAIRAAAHHDRSLFLEPELQIRRSLGYPPYARLANILIWGRQPDPVREEAGALAEKVNDALEPLLGTGGWHVLGPSPCVLGKLRGDWRWHLLVKSPPDADIAAALAPVFKTRKAVEGVSMAVDIDPSSLF